MHGVRRAFLLRAHLLLWHTSYSSTPPTLARPLTYRREASPPEARGHGCDDCCDAAGLSSAPHLASHLIPDYVHVPSPRQPQPSQQPSPPSTSRQAQCSPQLSAAAAGEARSSCSAEQREQVSPTLPLPPPQPLTLPLTPKSIGSRPHTKLASTTPH